MYNEIFTIENLEEKIRFAMGAPLEFFQMAFKQKGQAIFYVCKDILFTLLKKQL